MAKSAPRKKPFDHPGPEIEVDAWTIKCLYNRTSDYPQRVANGELVELHREPGKFRNGERTVQAYYGLAGGKTFLVKLQWFEDVNGNVTRSGEKEPKQIFWDGINYHQYPGSTPWRKFRRDVTLLWSDNESERVIAWKKRYGRWRKYKCSRFGPVEAVWRRQWFMSRPYAFYAAVARAVPRAWIRLRQLTKPIRSWVRRLILGPPTRVGVLA